MSDAVEPLAEARKNRERAYFDELANKREIALLDPKILARYSRPGVLYPRELAFRVLGDVSGKRLLDVGCGEGQDAVLLTRLGARVTGIDISSGAIRVAKERCAAEGLDAEFICAPIEDQPLGQYDIVWVEALLHHVLADLDRVMRMLVQATAPGGIIVMVEPVNLFPMLRQFRLRAFAAPHGTPDERPLEKKDLAIIKRHLPNLNVRVYRALLRVDQIILKNSPLERASRPQRTTMKILACLDYVLLSAARLRRLGSVAVMWSHV